MEKKQFELNDSELETVVGGQNYPSAEDEERLQWQKTIFELGAQNYGGLADAMRALLPDDASVYDVIRKECECGASGADAHMIIDLIRTSINLIKDPTYNEVAKDLLSYIEDDLAKHIF